MSEKLCLQWNDFQENIKSAFGNLREDKNFRDVTLVCEDDQQVEAHKVVLASCSPFFQKLLERNKHPHPLIYMRGLKLDDLLAIMDFVYRGEANVFQEKLDSFLAIAEELQLKGLMGNSEQGDEGLDTDKKRQPTQDLSASNDDSNPQKTSFKRETPEHSTIKTVVAEDDTTIAIPSNYSGDVDQLDEMVKSMMEKSQSKYADGHRKAHRCKVCGKEGKGNYIKYHIETNHIEGIVLPCNLCGKTFPSRKGLNSHKSNQHIKASQLFGLETFGSSQNGNMF